MFSERQITGHVEFGLPPACSLFTKAMNAKIAQDVLFPLTSIVFILQEAIESQTYFIYFVRSYDLRVAKRKVFSRRSSYVGIRREKLRARIINAFIEPAPEKQVSRRESMVDAPANIVVTDLDGAGRKPVRV